MTYEKGLLAQAELRNVRRSTTERKKMSTKTTFKRVALIAVASLGLGVLTSIAPANAAAAIFTGSTPGGTFDDDSDTLSIDQTSGANNFVSITTADAKEGVVTISGSKLSVAATVEEATVDADGLSASQTGEEPITYKIPTKSAGTITVKFFETDGGVTSTTVTETVEITVIDAAQLKVSAANSKSIITTDDDAEIVIGENYDNGNDGKTKDDTVTAVGVGNDGEVATIELGVVDGTAAKNPIDGDTLSAVITGAGLVLGDGANPARVATTEVDAGFAAFTVHADGTSGTGTITISDGKTVIATEKVTFSGAPKTITVTQNYKVGPGTDTFGTVDAEDGAVTLTVKDKDGILVPNADGEDNYEIVATSSDKTIIKGFTKGAGTIGNNDDGTYEVVAETATSTSGKSASVTYTIVDTDDDDTVLATSAAVKFAVGGETIASLVLSSDKAVYAPGDKITLTLTAKDADGFAVADGAYDVFTANSEEFAGLVASTSTTSAPFSYADDTDTGTAFTGGIATATMFAPLIGGPVSVSGTTAETAELDTAADELAVTVSMTVSSAAAGNSAQITSLLKKINALTKLIAKIQKKLGIK